MKRPGWAALAILGTLAWLGLMVAALYFGYEHRSPVRIPDWQPERMR